MTDFATRLERSRAMYASGEEDGRAVIADGRRISLALLAAYPKPDRASYLLGAANARRSLILVPTKAPEHRERISAALLARRHGGL